jgi:hypothetical protein
MGIGLHGSIFSVPAVQSGRAPLDDVAVGDGWLDALQVPLAVGRGLVGSGYALDPPRGLA